MEIHDLKEDFRRCLELLNSKFSYVAAEKIKEILPSI